jgi:transcription elongation GreA/GreB family factor
MPVKSQHHQTLKNLLAQRQFSEAEALWLDLAEQLHDQPDFLLLLVKEFADAGQPKQAAELAGLLAPKLKADGKNHEWLYALKIQAQAQPFDKPLRAEILAAYRKIYEADPRLNTILAAAALDNPATQLPVGLTRTDTLLALNTGHYCQHKSWGVGQIKSFDAALNRVVIAFPHNPDHAMQLPYAADSLIPISADHIEARKQTDLPGLQQLAAHDPVALVKTVLLSLGHAASADKIESILAGTVIPTADWKKWWESAKRLLKRDAHFDVPAKRTEPIQLRPAPLVEQDTHLENFRAAPSLKQKTATVRQFLKIVDTIADPDLLLQEFQDGLLDALKKLKAEYAADRLEAAFLIEDLRQHQKTPAESTTPLVAEILNGVRDLPGLLDNLTAAAQKRVVALAPDRLLQDLNRLPQKTLDVLAGKLEEHLPKLSNLVRNQTAAPDLLYWIYKNLDRYPWLQPLRGPALLQAILTAIEDGGAKQTKRLRDLLFSDDELFAALLANADTDAVKDISRHLLASPAFEELDRRSLMARIVKVFPFVQEFLVTKTVKESPLIVSKASYDKRRAELDEIITKRIPENSKEIGVARSYGDLRENFEFKAAKDLQKVLMRRRAELEILLSRAQTTDFSDAQTDTVGIGTTVTVSNPATGETHTYHILGAWDSDPARGIISYPAGLAQALLNKQTGDLVTATGETGTQQWRIEKIEKTPPEILNNL